MQPQPIDPTPAPQFGVYPQLPGGNVAPTLGGAVSAYLEHLALRVEAGDFSRDAYLNIQRNLSRFVLAWSVIGRDGRHWLVPITEPAVTILPNGRRHVKRSLKYSADSAEAAIAEAAKIAAGCKVGPVVTGLAVEPRVRSNSERPLGECSQDDLTRWLLANPQWQSDYSKGDALLAIVGCFSWFEDEYKVPAPYRRKRLPKLQKKPRREATTDEYVKLMGHGSSRQLRRALWCLYNVQGIRPGSMRNLKWTDFNWEGGYVLTYKHKTARATGKPLLIVLTPRQLRFFKNLHRQRPPWPDHVFLNTDGKPWTRNSFGQHLRRTAERIGLDEGEGGFITDTTRKICERVSAYCFRHTFATQADEAGVPGEDTAMVMGHANQRMLREVYSKASQKVQHNRRAAERIERLRLKARREAQKPRVRKKPADDHPELF